MPVATMWGELSLESIGWGAEITTLANFYAENEKIIQNTSKELAGPGGDPGSGFGWGRLKGLTCPSRDQL